MIRLYNLNTLKENDTNAVILSDNMMYVNHSSAIITIPIKMDWYIFHILVSKANISNVWYYLKKYNDKVDLTEIEIKYWDTLIFDLEYNFNLLHQNLSDEYKYYLHPRKKTKILSLKIKQDLTDIMNTIIYFKDIIVYSTPKMSFLESIFKFNTILKGKLMNQDLYVTREQYFNKIKEDNLIQRKKEKSFTEKFRKVLIRDRVDELYRDYWEKYIIWLIQSELDIIENRWFSEYFLTFYEITNYLRQNNFLYFIRWSWAGSIVLYLLGISHINPVKYWLSFYRFLGWNKTADIDIDVPWTERKRILRDLNIYFKKQWKEIFLITNKSSENYEKITVSPAWIIIEKKDIFEKIPIFNVTQHEQKVSELFESWTTPVLDQLGYLKYDLLSSQVSWPIQEIYKKNNLNVIESIFNWEKKLTWKDDYLKKLKKWIYFHFKASEKLNKILDLYTPKNFFDLVKLLAVNRPAMYYSLKIPEIVKNLNYWRIKVTKDKRLNEIIQDSLSWTMILFQDQAIDILEYILPNLDYSKIIKLVKAKVKDKEWIDLAMKNWKKHEKEFLTNFINKTNDKKLANQIWSQISNFNHYWLNKAHSFSYALVTYLELNSK